MWTCRKRKKNKTKVKWKILKNIYCNIKNLNKINNKQYLQVAKNEKKKFKERKIEWKKL